MVDNYVGLISGTSMDGIDAVIVSFDDDSVQIHATHSETYPKALREALLSAIREPLDVELDTSGDLDRQVGECFRDAALAVIRKSGCSTDSIAAIGSHGQTLRHQPNARTPFSLQIGDPEIIATGTGIRTIADFRRADIEAGGQGAPLVPPFHQWLFSSDRQNRVVLNIGGIANVTHLPADGSDVTGFDTGPGNGLMDAWIRRHKDLGFDENGKWAASGNVNEALLRKIRLDPYFALAAPKSTGFEYFNLDWLSQFGVESVDPADVQATLCELSASTIADAILSHCAGTDKVFVCGGGIHNAELMFHLSRNIPETNVSSTAAAGLDPDWVEAVAFAWLGKRHLESAPGNLPSVTGASQAVILGELHYP
jgi:anhydro-N-acetylmuramic acid kinase